MAYAYAVEHEWHGNINKALFLDKTEAENYSAKYHGTLVELWRSDNNKVSPHLCTTSKEDYLPQHKTVIPKPTL